MGSILPSYQIARRIETEDMVTDIPPSKDGCISTGLTSCGYDFTLDTAFRSISPTSVTLGPKYAVTDLFGGMRRMDRFTIGPGETLLAQSVEVFHIPKDLIGVGANRAVYATFGITMCMADLLPGYVGKARFTIFNPSQNGILLHPNEGFATIRFVKVDLEDGEPDLYTGKYTNKNELVVLPPVVLP